jgi:hypothetical protein
MRKTRKMPCSLPSTLLPRFSSMCFTNSTLSTFSQRAVNVQSTFSQHSAEDAVLVAQHVTATLQLNVLHKLHPVNIQSTFSQHSAEDAMLVAQHLTTTLQLNVLHKLDSINIQSTFSEHSVNIR